MTDKKLKEISFEKIGGRKILQHVPEKRGGPIDLSHIGGIRVGQDQE